MFFLGRLKRPRPTSGRLSDRKRGTMSGAPSLDDALAECRDGGRKNCSIGPGAPKPRTPEAPKPRTPEAPDPHRRRRGLLTRLAEVLLE